MTINHHHNEEIDEDLFKSVFECGDLCALPSDEAPSSPLSPPPPTPVLNAQADAIVNHEHTDGLEIPQFEMQHNGQPYDPIEDRVTNTSRYPSPDLKPHLSITPKYPSPSPNLTKHNGMTAETAATISPHHDSENLRMAESLDERTAEFEQATEQRRSDSRSNLEENESASAAKEREATATEETTSGENEPGPATKERILSDEIVSEIKQHNPNRKTFNEGNVAIVVDTDDLSKTLLLPSVKLLGAATALAKIPPADGEIEIRYAFLLDVTSSGKDEKLPILQKLDPAEAVTEFYLRYRKPITRSRSGEDIRVKKEGDGAAEDEVEANIDWLNAYKAAFAAIIDSQKYRKLILRLVSTGNEPILAQIQAVLAIAEQYGAISSVRSSMELLLMDLQQHKTLWKAVAANPAGWLNVGKVAEHKMVYEEALIHLIGSYPTCREQMRECGISEDIQRLVESKSERLRISRIIVDQELLLMGIKAEAQEECGGKGKKKSNSTRTVLSLAARQTVKEWREHMVDHLRDLGDNLTAFYRSIYLGGDAYLPADEFISDWDLELDKHGEDENNIRETLKKLKKAASEKVVDLLKSELQYENRDELEYLTCVNLEESDIPWKKDEDVEMEDD